jgi:hypothetical protein
LIQIRLAQARDPENNRTMRQITRIFAAAMLLGIVVPAQAQPAPVDAPFTETLSNATPLAFGMAADTAARALGTPLSYISGRPGNEIYLAIRTVGGSGFFDRRDRLFLQFRAGRLTGWKGDWGRNWMWQ